MGWTNKVANVIKGRIGNMVAGAITNKLMSSFADAGQTKKVAAKLLSKSPLEIGNMSPTAHMAENPYSYGTVCYTQETANLGDGHYVMFDILTDKHSKYKSSTFDNGRLTDDSKNYVGEKFRLGSARKGTFNKRIK